MRDIVIIVLDSYRADTYWQQGQVISPELWALHSDFAAYRQAHTTASWTLPSHATLFTGLYASEHGKHSGAYGADIALSPDITTLAELAKAKGYATAGFSSNPWVGQNSGMNRGFDLFVEFDFHVTRCGDGLSRPFPILSRTSRLNRRLASTRLALLKRPYISRKMTDGLLAFMERVPSGQPLFAFINLMDPHNPYQPPRSLLAMFAAGPQLWPERRLNLALGAYIGGRRAMDAVLQRNVWAYYHASLAHASQQVGRIMEGLRHARRYEEVAVFILSDHGKTLGEYDRTACPLHYITDINTRIPLLAKLPGLKPGTHDEAVSLIDIFYSALDLLNEPANPNHGLKRSRLEDRGQADDWVPNETLIPYSGQQVFNPDLVRSVTDGRFKYIRSGQRGEMLWDNHTDASQTQNLIERFPDALRKAREVFQTWLQTLLPFAQSPTPGGEYVEDMDPVVLKRLQDLGYL